MATTLASQDDLIINLGGGGERLLEEHDGIPSMLDQGTIIDAHYIRGCQNILVMWGGSNDLFGITHPIEDIEAGLAQWCAARKTAHPDTKIVLGTYLPRAASKEADRQILNQWIRNNYATIADGLADMGNDANIGQAGQNKDLTYYIEDQVHLNADGYAIVAGIVWAAVTAIS